MAGMKLWRETLYNYVKSNPLCSTDDVYEYLYDNWPKTVPMRSGVKALLTKDKRLLNLHRGKKNTLAEWTLVKQKAND